MEIKDKIRGWNIIEHYLLKVRDARYRSALKAELAARAEKYWGWLPVKADFDHPDLDAWEENFVRQIEIAIQYGVKPKDFGGEAHKALCEMTNFVRHGGTLEEIPAEIRTPCIVELYQKVVQNEHRGLMELADSVINRLKHP